MWIVRPSGRFMLLVNRADGHLFITVLAYPLMATPNCSTYGHPNCSTPVDQILYFLSVWFCLTGMAISPWIFEFFIKRLFGKRSASGRRRNAGERWATVASVRSTDCPQARPVGRTVVHGGRVPHKPLRFWIYESLGAGADRNALPVACQPLA